MTPTTQTENDQDFTRLVECLQQVSATTQKLAELEVRVNKASQAIAANSAVEYCVHQENLTKAEEQARQIFERHPEWRGEKKSVSTPFGSVESRKVTEIDIPNPALTVALIEARGLKDPQWKPDTFLHVEKEPDIEALERLGDADLVSLGCQRVERTSVTVKPAKVSVAKAAKAAQKASIPPQVNN